jgi:hypothetical protein
MKALLAFVSLAFVSLAIFSVSAHAATQAEAEAAVADAKRAEAAAAQYNNRWVPAETALAAAEKAIAAQAWDEAVAQATKASAMGMRAVEQSKEQETAWHDAVIR